MNRKPQITIALTVALCATLWTVPAWACSILPLPAFQLDDQVVPSTVAGALFRTCDDRFDDEYAFSLFVDESDEEVAISVEPYLHGIYEISFDEDLEPHQTYRFEVNQECMGHTEEAGQWFFDTAEAEEMPTLIGSWEANNPAEDEVVFEDGPGCQVEAQAAFVDFFFNPSEEGGIWGEALVFETYVNEELWMPRLTLGQPFVGHSRLGWGLERVYSVCEDQFEQPQDWPYAAALEQGINYIQIIAWLPGTDQVWSTENELFVLRCDEGDDEENDDNGDDNGENGENEEDEPSEAFDEEEPGGCSTTGAGTPTGFFLVLAMVGLYSVRRNRITRSVN